jgi:hypothetical protein
MQLRILGLAAAVASLPIAAQAVMITGQLEIAGGLVNLTTVNFEDNGNLDFINNTADVDFASGSFSFLQDSIVSFNNLNFVPGEEIYLGDNGLRFTAQSFSDFDNTSSDWAYMANGTIELDGFEATPGIFAFSTQTTGGQSFASFSSSTTPTPIPVPASVLMLLGALTGLSLLGRRRDA